MAAKSLDAEMTNFDNDIERYNKEVDEALAQVKAGDYTTHEDLEKEMEQW